MNYDGPGDIVGVAVPVFDRSGAAVAAIAVTGFRDTVNHYSVSKHLPMMRETATSIARYFNNPADEAASIDRDIHREYVALVTAPSNL